MTHLLWDQGEKKKVNQECCYTERMARALLEGYIFPGLCNHATKFRFIRIFKLVTFIQIDEEDD